MARSKNLVGLKDLRGSVSLGNESVVPGQGGRFRAVACPQFGEDIAHMIFNGGDSDMQLGGDFGVRKSFDEESQDLPFTTGEIVPWPGF